MSGYIGSEGFHFLSTADGGRGAVTSSERETIPPAQPEVDASATPFQVEPEHHEQAPLVGKVVVAAIAN